MQIRGAPLIGAVAAYGLCLALREDAGNAAMEHAAALLMQTRPTAVNLHWALHRMLARLRAVPSGERVRTAYAEAAAIADEDVAQNAALGTHGLALIAEAARAKAAGTPVNVLTHCNAGWLATVDWGTALAPIYQAHESGIAVHVWVDETRPRNQGASLTAWELGHHGVKHTVIADNAGGHLMQHGDVDLVIVGADRVTAPAMSRTRSAPISRPSPRATTPSRSGSRCPPPRSTGASPTASPRSRSRSASRAS